MVASCYCVRHVWNCLVVTSLSPLIHALHSVDAPTSLPAAPLPPARSRHMQVVFTTGLGEADRAALLAGAADKAGEHLGRLLKFVVARAGAVLGCHRHLRLWDACWGLVGSMYAAAAAWHIRRSPPTCTCNHVVQTMVLQTGAGPRAGSSAWVAAATLLWMVTLLSELARPWCC